MSISCFIASGCAIATTHLYRCVHFQEQLQALGHEARVAQWFEEAKIDAAAALRCDVIFLYRLPMSGPLRAVTERGRELGKPVIFDTDDLIFEPSWVSEHRAVRALTPSDQIQYAEGVQRYLETLQACDATVTATPLLAELARLRAKPAYVHRNSLGHDMLAHANELHRKRQRRPDRGEIVIGYGSGTATHDVDFEEATAALVSVLERFPHVQLWIGGPLKISPLLEAFGARVRRFPLTGWRDWFELLSRIDIALAPLEAENIFCRAKSEIKFVEAGALGVPLVASRIDPFRDAISDGEDGLLAASESDWMRALSSLIEQPEQRRFIGERAREIVLRRHSPAARTRDLRFLLPQLAPALFPPAPAGRATLVRQIRRLLARPRKKERLTINWLVPEPSPGAGGDVGIFRIIRYLAEFGHDCQVYVVTYEAMTDFSTEQIRENIREHFGETPAQYHRWRGDLGNADCTFATFWPTVENLTGLLKGGRRYYLVQDFEPSFYPDDPLHYQRAENTYRAGLHCVTLGPWLAKMLRERYGATADHFDFAVDAQLYRPRLVERRPGGRVCFYARPATPRRAYELGLAAFQSVKKQLPEVEIVFFGASELTPLPSFPFVDRGKLSQGELAKLFSGCDLGVVFSLTNPSFVPLEMMACGCAVLELQSERWEGTLTHGRDAWLVQPTPDAVAKGIVELLRNSALGEALAAHGSERARSMSWHDSARQIEKMLLRNST
ncbi:MAG: glycosyltransferase [Chthoniobacterales bacterium]|nr:glycosyltransferase [Chthoniobacterales bacterium]